MSFLAIVLLAPSSGVAANKPNWHLGDRTLRQGVEGHDVKVLQQFLQRAGHRTEIDGAFGSGTKRVVRAFERSQRLRVDGKVTAADVRVLRDRRQPDRQEAVHLRRRARQVGGRGL